MLPITFMALIDDEKDQVLFRKLFDDYERKFINIAYKNLGDYTLAEDAVLESFFKISKCFQKIHNFELSKIVAYAVIIIKYTCYDMLEEESKIRTVSDDLTEDIPDEHYKDLPDKMILSSSVKNLPDIYRDVIILKYYYGFSIQEMAEQLGLSYNGVRYRLDTAIKLLRKEFKDD